MRKSASERREEVLAVAMEHFATGGYHGTSTEGIAREAGISHAYLFRLFPTKRELFLACGDRAAERVVEAFRRAAAGAEPGQELKAMGDAYASELLPDRHAILMLMHSFAAGGADPGIRDHVRNMYGTVVTEVTELAAADPDDVWDFFANGMLLNIVAALDLHESDHPVFRAWTALPA